SGPGERLTWAAPTLAAGGSGTIVFTVTVDADASFTLTNNVVIASATHDPNPSNDKDEEITSITTPPCAIIFGTVFIDADGDGVRDATEPGIGGVSITLDGVITTTTDLDGHYVLSTTVAGVRTVVETDLPFYTPNSQEVSPTDLKRYFSTTPNKVRTDVILGNSYQIDFGDALTNFGFASIPGTVFEDSDGDGIWDEHELGIPGVLVTLDEVTTTTTNINGSYTFSTTVTGVHTVIETDPDGYFSTKPNEVHVSANLDKSYQVRFGDAPAASGFASIYGTVFNDTDTDGTYDANETGVSGVTVTLDASAVVATDLYGGYTFSTTMAISHTIVETNPNEYLSTTPDEVYVAVTPGRSYQVDFGDTETTTCDPDTYEEDDTVAYARRFIVGTIQAHQFCDDATDWVEFTAQASTVYTIATSSWGQRADTFLTLFDTDGHTPLGSNDDYSGTTDHSSRIVWQAPTDGDYYVLVTNQGEVIGHGTEYNLLIAGQDPFILYLPTVMRRS
ncbi:MAG: SdrD B-like domain-containing protein, partial [Chloroflexota bacterium]|nr:SdrD B-like domain-containing protein [Chloroflexota bacterium]